MSEDISKGRWVLNHLPYIGTIMHDWDNLRTIGIKIRKYPRLLDDHGRTTLTFHRKYPPRLMWVKATRSGPVKMGWRLWSQQVK